MVLVDDGVILGIHDRIKGLQHKMATMHREAQYQVCLFVRLWWLAPGFWITLYAVMDNSVTGKSWQQCSIHSRHQRRTHCH